MSYSTWHRELGSDQLGFIDLDWVEFCPACYRILAVYELTADGPSAAEKKCWITKKIASALGVKGYLVAYQKDRGAIVGFRVRQLAPVEQEALTSLTADEWATRIFGFRWCHPVSRPAVAPGAPDAAHLCGWARVAGGWECVQDHNRGGPGCGKRMAA